MIVNRGENDGFVIIRSEGDSHTILGYSEHGHINTEAMPENLRYWLQCYVAENEQTILSYKNDHVKYKAHAPLLTTIAWDQNDPYNLMTPYYVGTTHAATGCAATAMAQILYFHHWPLQGKGTASYKCSTLNNATLTADFSKDTYNWASMKPQYNIPGDNDQESSREAVALLMRDCGYAIHMLYGAQSGADTGLWPAALVDNFSYDKGIGLLNRQYYTQQEWDDIIHKEIDNNRPVFAAPSEAAAITTTHQLSAGNVLPIDSIAVTASLTGNAGVYAGDITAYIYDATGKTVMGSFNPQFVMIEKGQTVTIPLHGTFENGIPGTTYMLRLVDLTNSSFITPKDLASCTFVLSSPTTDINANSAPAIKHPHSAVSYDLRGIRIYDHHHGAVIVGKKKMIK